MAGTTSAKPADCICGRAVEAFPTEPNIRLGHTDWEIRCLNRKCLRRSPIRRTKGEVVAVWNSDILTLSSHDGLVDSLRATLGRATECIPSGVEETCRATCRYYAECMTLKAADAM